MTPYLSYEAEIAYRVRVEVALLRGYAAEGLLASTLVDEVEGNSSRVTATGVAAREEVTRHETAALVAELCAAVPRAARSFVHLGATSSDIIDTANSLRYREMTVKVFIPAIQALAETCGGMAKRGDKAITSVTWRGHQGRLLERLSEVKRSQIALHGKFSGAVGTYASFGLLVPDPRGFERSILARLGLTPPDISTQIVPGEGWADIAHAYLTTFGVVASLARVVRDARIRGAPASTEGDAIVQDLGELLSVWRMLVPRAMAVLADQISEHQRDLTNSASHRFLGEIMGGTAWAATLLDRALAQL